MPQLIQQAISKDTLKCALHLAEGVESGAVVGAVLGLIYKRRRYSVVVCGDANSDPTFARGVCAAIEDELRELIHQRGQTDTTL